MNIAHINDSSGFYGAENMLLDLLQLQKSRSMSVVLLSLTSQPSKIAEIAQLADAQGIDVVNWPMKPGFDVLSMWRLMGNSRAEGINLEGVKIIV
ncbi:MAG: hypothetical protein HRU20_16625 [Pseudomonadales bacterium]|nr:hypothetical protein [Pseudomonadales bacterium]